ncbi:hypothetical protein H5410_051849 [Solanum commersonii]|uniref:Uncharacterized protein n=1 Tax=Solanum commersonii TaxID=4109 RepID=A0A9J5X1X6_SOLCO|nr:hypothetical protein H5410_051849 [Solanum commersonii]
MDHRLWMYNMHYETGAGLKPEFIDGVRDFIEHTMALDIFKNNGLVGWNWNNIFDEALNEETRCFYDQLEEFSRSLCEGSLHSSLPVTVRLMNIKSDWNVPNAAMDSMVDDLGELVNPEFNIPKNFYQAKHLLSKRNKPNCNDEGNIDLLFPPISIFNQNGEDLKSVESEDSLIWKCNQVYDEYSSVQHLQLEKEVALRPEFQVLSMNKYCVNGFKFQTKEVSRNKKTNNSGVYKQGDVDGTGQTIEYYGVIHEIIELRYSSWPKKKIVLFRCGDGDRHREHLGVSQTKQAKKKKSWRTIDPKDIAGSISSAQEWISHDTHLFVVLFGTANPR